MVRRAGLHVNLLANLKAPLPTRRQPAAVSLFGSIALTSAGAPRAGYIEKHRSAVAMLNAGGVDAFAFLFEQRPIAAHADESHFPRSWRIPEIHYFSDVAPQSWQYHVILLPKIKIVESEEDDFRRLQLRSMFTGLGELSSGAASRCAAIISYAEPAMPSGVGGHEC
jgi:hypothetical protein